MIIRELLLDDLDGRSVYTAMQDCWRDPGHCPIEVDEEVFHEVAQYYTANLAYYQVLLAALRHFPCLSTTPPRCEKRQKIMQARVDEASIARFLRGAQRQGFQSEKLVQTLSNPSPSGAANIAPSGFNSIEALRKRRCGRPFTDSFTSFASLLYVPRCMSTAERGQYPSAIFVQADIVHVFLGKLAVCVSYL